jgi:protein transport protein SEC61 subunit gamma-like protein
LPPRRLRAGLAMPSIAVAARLRWKLQIPPRCRAPRCRRPRLTARRRLAHRRLLKRCEKPDAKEFAKVARLTAVGFLAVGFIGFFVKLIFIPINQIIVSHASS